MFQNDTTDHKTTPPDHKTIPPDHKTTPPNHTTTPPDHTTRHYATTWRVNLVWTRISNLHVSVSRAKNPDFLGTCWQVRECPVGERSTWVCGTVTCPAH